MSPLIDGYEFPEKTEGMTLVDAYYIPDEEVERYRAEREYVAQLLTEVFSQFCTTVDREFAGDQDGEAITGCDASGTLIALIHLDPSDVAYCLEAQRKKRLLEAVLAMNDMSFSRYRELRREIGIARERKRRAQH